MPKVSILFPVYNEKPEYLSLALDSLTNQTFQDFELLILDDSSSRETRMILDNFCTLDRRAIVFRRNERGGITSALNIGIRSAKGEYIARADSDDIQVLNRLEQSLEYFSNYPDTEVLGSAVFKMDLNGNVMGTRSYPLSHEDIVKTSCIKNPMAHPTIMIKRSVLIKNGGYDEGFSSAEDYELWSRLISKRVKFSNMKEALVFYRMPPITKRSHDNWKNNLKVKLRYFSYRFLIARILGIMIVITYMIIPEVIKVKIHAIYNG